MSLKVDRSPSVTPENSPDKSIPPSLNIRALHEIVKKFVGIEKFPAQRVLMREPEFQVEPSAKRQKFTKELTEDTVVPFEAKKETLDFPDLTTMAHVEIPKPNVTRGNNKPAFIPPPAPRKPSDVARQVQSIFGKTYKN